MPPQASVTGRLRPRRPSLWSIPSWCVLPLIVEGRGRRGRCFWAAACPAALDEAVLHRVRALAFSASAALQRAHRHEQVRLFADLARAGDSGPPKAIRGRTTLEVARALLLGALQLGEHPAGLLVLEVEDDAASWRCRVLPRPNSRADAAPAALSCQTAPFRLEGEALERHRRAALACRPRPHRCTWCRWSRQGPRSARLVVVDPDGETPDDRLMEAYTSRAGVAYQFALGRR